MVPLKLIALFPLNLLPPNLQNLDGAKQTENPMFHYWHNFILSLTILYFTDINVGKVGISINVGKVGTSINVLMQINHNTSILFHGGILMPSSENFRGILNSSNPSVAGEGDSRVIHTKT